VPRRSGLAARPSWRVTRHGQHLIVNRRRHIDVAQAAVDFRIARRRLRKTRPLRAARAPSAARDHNASRLQKWTDERCDCRHARSLGGKAGARARASGFLRGRSFDANGMHHVCFRSIVQARRWLISAKAMEGAALMPDAACGATRLILVNVSAENWRWLFGNYLRKRPRDDS
jgi:hypothetical protein